jgi:hypothetical protein
MSKGRIVLGIVFLVLFIYFATNLINILYRHHAFGVSEKETKAENGPNDHPAKLVPTEPPQQQKKDEIKEGVVPLTVNTNM